MVFGVFRLHVQKKEELAELLVSADECRERAKAERLKAHYFEERATMFAKALVAVDRKLHHRPPLLLMMLLLEVVVVAVAVAGRAVRVMCKRWSCCLNRVFSDRYVASVIVRVKLN